MAAPRKTAAERKREEREDAQRKAKQSVRIGTVGVAVLFLCGLGAWLAPAYAYGFIGGMVLGILLLLFAFTQVRGSVLTFKGDDETKLY